MKKIVLSLALAAFIGGGTLFALNSTSNNSEIVNMEIIQDGKKKSKATKKEEYKSDKAKSDCKTKSDCKKNDVLNKKSCCSHGKAAKKSKSSPEKK